MNTTKRVVRSVGRGGGRSTSQRSSDAIERVRDALPEAILDEPVWLLWKSLPSNKGKPRKVPFYADGGTRAGPLDSDKDRSRLVDFDTAAAAFDARPGKYTGLALALGRLPDGRILSGLDLDDCRTDGKLSPNATRVVKVADSYTEVSPSQNGIKIFGFGDIGEKGPGDGLEIYSGGRFFTVTGDSINGAEFSELTQAAKTARRLFGVPARSEDIQLPNTVRLPKGLADEAAASMAEDSARCRVKLAPTAWDRTRAELVEALAYIDETHRPSWIKVGMAIHLACGGSEDGFGVWHEWSTGEYSGEGAPDNYVSEKDCRRHWDSFKHDKAPAETLTVASIFKLARETGWKKDAPEADKTPVLLRPLHSIVAERREPRWLIHKEIEAGVLAVLAGARSTFKSFVALHWTLQAAMAGHGGVILSGEGAGLDRRVAAWMQTYGAGRDLKSLPVYALERAKNLNLAEELAIVKDAIAALPYVAEFVVIDTLSKFSAGLDENSNEEMAAFLGKLAVALRDALSCTVLLVAHSGHSDKGRPRGAYALMANPDAEYVCTRASATDMTVTVSRERFKDYRSLPPLAYLAKVVDLGRVDIYGEPVTSLALENTDIPETARSQPLGKAQRALLDALHKKGAGHVWTIEQLRAIARETGAAKTSAQSAAKWLTESRHLIAASGGWRLV